MRRKLTARIKFDSPLDAPGSKVSSAGTSNHYRMTNTQGNGNLFVKIGVKCALESTLKCHLSRCKCVFRGIIEENPNLFGEMFCYFHWLLCVMRAHIRGVYLFEINKNSMKFFRLIITAKYLTRRQEIKKSHSQGEEERYLSGFKNKADTVSRAYCEFHFQRLVMRRR